MFLLPWKVCFWKEKSFVLFFASQNPGSLRPNRLVNAPNWLLVNAPIHWDPTEHVTLDLIFLSQHYNRVISTSCTLWELDCEESWAPKNWCFWTVVFEKTLESPLNCMEIQPVHPKGNQSWIFIERIDAETETPILSPPDARTRLIWKDPDAGKDWR